MSKRTFRNLQADWAVFPGGELEGQRPRVLCRACRRGGSGQAGTLCFQCYRAHLDRDRALRAAANLDTGSEARFQEVLPFEPIQTARLVRLKVERQRARDLAGAGLGRLADRRRRAQMAAREALRGIAARTSVIHAAELQLPSAWLPFVLSR